MSRFYFGSIVILLVLSVMLPEYTTIKMKLFSQLVSGRLMMSFPYFLQCGGHSLKLT